MIKKVKITVSSKEYHQKRYEIAKDLLAAVISREYLEMTDSKLHESMTYNSVHLADALLNELGITAQGEVPIEPAGDKSIHSLAELLRSEKK
jgi:hypothetical protein